MRFPAAEAEFWSRVPGRRAHAPSGGSEDPPYIYRAGWNDRVRLKNGITCSWNRTAMSLVCVPG